MTRRKRIAIGNLEFTKKEQSNEEWRRGDTVTRRKELQSTTFNRRDFKKSLKFGKEGQKMLKKTLALLGTSILVVVLWVTIVPAQQRGVTDTEISVGQWGPQTGPAAAWGAVARGSGLLFKILNEEGGINGRKFKYFLRDDAYQPAKTKAIVKEFIEQIGVFGVVGGVGAGPGMAVRDDLMENKVVWVGVSTGIYEWIKPFQKYLFAVYPLYDDEAYNLTGYLYEK